MNTSEKKNTSRREWISPGRITSLVINAICFGACIVLLAVGTASGPLVLLTIATGLSLGAGLTGAIAASRKPLASDEKAGHRA